MCQGIDGMKDRKILEIRDVTYTYDGEELPVWEHLSCCFYEGKIHAVSGPSGCGKSSVLSLKILQEHFLDTAATGSVL